ncbi:Zinc finger, C3HC4 type (RING finger)/Ring finger domain containing protein [Novymonas esmeraldas]|uniref:Zinc finger, C3HC4 type (RING finger)/Ring finger domain containing protein n=1 Tax=Novymonas esmeraldas TaxID=1808958 RepID=A0AAW0FBA0_9TRYP
MEHRLRPELTFAQARYVNASHPATATFPAGCDLFASLSSGGSMAMDFVRVAVPALALVMLLLWMARAVVVRIEARRIRQQAAHWKTLPSYTEVQAMAAALRPQRRTPAAAAATAGGDETHCTICLAAAADHPVELLPCGHQQFCAHCLVQLWEYSGTYRRLRCPLCRQPVEMVCPVLSGDATPSVDDVLLLRKYNGGFCGAKKLSLPDRCVLRLRAITHARLLPIVIGLRIAILHVTMFTYVLLPTSLAEAFADASRQPLLRVAKAAAPSSPIVAAGARAVQGFTTVVYTAAIYADDIFLVAVSIIVTGHLLQKALFKDLKL